MRHRAAPNFLIRSLVLYPVELRARLCLAATGMAGGWGGNNYSSLPAKASRTAKVDRDG